MTHLSHDKNSGEVHTDKYNIDFLRYYSLRDFIMDCVGSLLGLFLWTHTLFLFERSLIISLNFFYLLYFGFGILFFFFCFFIAYGAVRKKKDAARISGRRGLFTFTVLVVSSILYLIGTGYITWNQLFIDFLRYIMVGMISAALFAIPFSYGFSFLIGLTKKGQK